MIRRSNNLTLLSFGIALLATALVPMPRAIAQGPVFAAPVTLDSFENPGGVSRWIPTADPIYIGHSQSNIGPTDGANSMLLEVEGAAGQFGEWGALLGWAVQGDFTPADPAGYAAWQMAAANPEAWNLQFDITTNAGSWTNAPPATTDPFSGGVSASTLRVGLSYQDDLGTSGFGQVDGQNLYLVEGRNTFSTRLSSLQQAGVPIGATSGYYSVLIGAHNRFFRDTPGGAKYYIDNVRLKPAPPQIPVTLFSWETADNPATPDVNEAHEGWSDAGLNEPSGTSPGDAYAHRHSVTTYGATHGTKALKIDTTTQDPEYVNPLGLPQSYGFRWGSLYTLDTANPPAGLDAAQTQAKITDLAGKVNNGDFIQFDLTVSDPIGEGTGFFQGGSTAALPGFLSIELSIQDGRGSFFQAGNPHVLNGAEIQNMVLNNPDSLEPLKVSIPLAAFTNVSGDAMNRMMYPTLKAAPIPLDTTFMRINLALNFNTGPVVAHIDNFRILTPISLDADFNHDGKVDGADLTIWKSNFGPNMAADADLDGDTDGADFLTWQRQLGNSGIGGSLGAVPVPEPASVVLLAAVALVALVRSRAP